MHQSKSKKIFFSLFFLFSFSVISSYAQVNTKQKGLLWEITGNGLKKPSYVYGTMHISQKLAFHLGDSFYNALLKCDMVALEQNLDSVIHRWISEEDEKPEDANKVYRRSMNEYLGLTQFQLGSFNKDLIERKLSAEVREVNYLLKRGNENDFEEDAWLDLYIYQIGKRTGKQITGVEGYEESRDLVEKSNKEPEASKAESKKKLKPYSYKMREQVSEAYRKGNIFMIDSIDRMTESEHFREYMLYKRNANMVRRMDSIVKLGKTLFTGVGCAHLPGSKGVLQMLIEKGYKVRPVQSIANEKSKLAQKYEDMTYNHDLKPVTSDDGLITANLPTRLTKVRDYESYASYLCPDLANGYYYQIEKISSNLAFSGKTQEDVLLVIDTMTFENIPGEQKKKERITSNGFPGIEVITELKTGDLNRFHILVSPYNVYIVRMAGKKKFATSSVADNFFKNLKINEGVGSTWQTISSGDSIYSLQLPVADKSKKLIQSSKADPSFEHIVFEKSSGNTYVIKQVDVLNSLYLEQDTFELGLMAKSFCKTDDFAIKSRKNFVNQGYNGLEVVFETKKKEKMYAKFFIAGTRYIMFLLKPSNKGSFDDKFFTSLHFNGKPTYNYTAYKDTNIFFSVKTPSKPYLIKNFSNYNYYYNEDDEESKPNKYKGEYKEMYFPAINANEFISVGAYKYGYYESQDQSTESYFSEWEKNTYLKIINKQKVSKKNVDYFIYTYTDTNTNRQIKMVNALHGQMRYFIYAFVDTVAGKPDFVNTFINTFDVSDTLIEGNIFEKKGKRFFADFTSKDSAARKASIKNFRSVTFTKNDIKDIQNVIDTINMKGDAAKMRTALIYKLSTIDSADALIVPYLQKLYTRFVDTAFLQIEILQAMARQRTLGAYKAIKPIIATDIPISDNTYDMENLLYSFSDTLKLTKTLLPELIELTTLQEYRNSAYAIISQMKDSGIINVADYASIHNRLITESRVEYKRTMASLTKEKNTDYEGGSDYDYAPTPAYRNYNYNDYGSSSSSVFTSLLELTLPLVKTNATMKTLSDKILAITDNNLRISLMPVLLKNGLSFQDSVYETLAKNKDFRIKLYQILSEAKKMDKFPKKYHNQREIIAADIYQSGGRYAKVDSTVLIKTQILEYGKKKYRIHFYKYHLEDEENWMLYASDALPTDTLKLNNPKDILPFYALTTEITETDTEAKVIGDILFDNYIKYVRENNGGYYESYYDRGGRNYGGYDYEY